MKHPRSNLSGTSTGGDSGERPFHSEIVDRIRTQGNIWSLPGGQLLLPEVFGFCRGVERALEMLQEAIRQCNDKGRRIFLLGEIIHNPWVNSYFQQQGVGVLSRREAEQLDRHVTVADCTVIPAFGVPLDV
ncbi:MAG: 4-hydroxy-3-methylbut-2-enyl diphosphate reductase, partial [Phycisphaerae bacterium]|nr:4-hydroxy-3-methylbut-2-enyl diphosphate reductase [Phycisphaerae bacterium]